MIQNILIIILSFYSLGLQASELADGIISSYGNLSKYEDEGILVSRVTKSNGESSRKELMFTTKFNEGGDLRFYWRELTHEYFKENGELDKELTEGMNFTLPLSEYYFERSRNVSHSNYRGKRKVIQDFCRSYAGATGISHGVAALVPRYLLADECYGYPHLILPNAKPIGVSHGKELVEITYHDGSSAELHFNKGNGMLEKYKSTRKLDLREIETTINYVVKAAEF